MATKNLKIVLQVGIFALIGFTILYFLWQSLGNQYMEECRLNNIPPEECSLVKRLAGDFRSADPFWLIIISICFLVSQILRSVRWVMMLQPLGYSISQFNSFASVMSGYFANLAAPRLGEIVRAGLITKYERVAIEKAFATIVVERVVDVLMFFIMIVLGLIFRYDQLWGYIAKNAVIPYTAIIILLVALALGAIVGLYFINNLLKTNDDQLSKWPLKLKSLIKGFLEGLAQTRNMKNVGLFWTYSVGIWSMYYLMHYLAFFSFKPVAHLAPLDGLLVFDFGTLGILFPSQGGLGSYHFMIVEALKIFDVNAIDGMSFAMITFFTLTIFCTVLFGIISLVLLPIVNKKRINGSDE